MNSKYASFYFDFSRCEVKSKQSVIELEPKVMAVLALLHARQGEVISSQEIFEKVWVGRVYNQSLVQRAITLIRKALNEDAASATLLKTYSKKGYCLTAQPVTKNITKPLFIVLAILVLFGGVLFNQSINSALSTNKNMTFTTLAPVVSKQENEYSLSQNTYTGALLFIRKSGELYELWQQSKGQEVLRYTSKVKITSAFWFENQPVFICQTDNRESEFVHLYDDQSARTLASVDLFLNTPPEVLNEQIYFTSSSALYALDANTGVYKIIHVFSDVKNIVDISFSAQQNSVAVLADMGQGNNKIIQFDLTEQIESDVYQDFGSYYSVDWHPSNRTLLVSNGNQLAIVSLEGELIPITYVTNKAITDAQFSANGEEIYIIQKTLRTVLSLFNGKGNTGSLLDIDYSGVNVSPVSNPVSSTFLFQSNFTGKQTLYLNSGSNNKVLATANKNVHFNGFAWSADGSNVAFAVGNKIFLHNTNELVSTHQLDEALYIRGWYKDLPYLLVNQNVKGEAYPSRFNIKTAELERLTQKPASCAVLDKQNNLYFVQEQQLIVKAANGKRKIINTLTTGEYNDLFVSDGFLYASIQALEGEQVQKVDLANLTMTSRYLGSKAMLAGVTHDDKLWVYSDVRYASEIMKLY